MLALVAASAPAAEETVTYPELKGFKSITYKSEFFGYQSGVNRDFTNYGRGFAEPVTQDTGIKQSHAVLADIDGDGLSDLVTRSWVTGNVTWVKGKGDGRFDTSRPHTFAARKDGQLVAGDFDGDGRAEIGIVRWGKMLRWSSRGKSMSAFRLPVDRGLMVGGDFDGDGLDDLGVYDPAKGTLRVLFRRKPTGFEQAAARSLPGGARSVGIVAADFNGDRYCDIGLVTPRGNPFGLAFLFGRGSGQFGPTAAEEKGRSATHLYANFEWEAVTFSEGMALAGQIDADGSADIGVYQPSRGRIITRIQSYHPAYDYSVHLVKDGSQYKMWHGGRWRTLGKDGEALPAADGDHVMYAWSPDGRRWFRKIDDAAFPKGDELGIHDWWTNNYLEPEVLKVNGKYYMFWQAEVDGGQKLDYGGTAARQCDRIGLSTSKDGVNWERKTDHGVVINVPNPTNTNLDHQEAIYVPDDKDGKPWWLYTFHFADGAPAGHVRMRSKDPTTFDWNLREPVSGMSQIGNQIGYADEAPGGRMFFRITFTGTTEGRNAPTFQLSRDGINWVTASSDDQGRPQLASSTDDKNNKNVCFLGMSTVDGTGKMEHLGGGRFRCLYGATTSNSPGQPDIWFSEIGIGEAYITFDKDGR